MWHMRYYLEFLKNKIQHNAVGICDIISPSGIFWYYLMFYYYYFSMSDVSRPSEIFIFLFFIFTYAILPAHQVRRGVRVQGRDQ